MIEAVRHDDLLVVNLGTDVIYRNDQVAPHLILLKHRDQFRVGRGPIMEVAIFNRPFIGAPPPELIGTICPVCRMAFSKGTRLYRCTSCGCGLHLEEGEEDEALQCALVSGVCPCHHPVKLTSGYLSNPQLMEDDE